MVIDTSVIIHTYLREPGWQRTLMVLSQEDRRICSVASLVEAQAVITSRSKQTGKALLGVLDEIVEELGLEAVPLTLKQSRLARAAYLEYGKGQGHKAALNYGDVMSYALAKDSGERLAFVGNDFQHTDLRVLNLPPSA